MIQDSNDSWHILRSPDPNIFTDSPNNPEEGLLIESEDYRSIKNNQVKDQYFDINWVDSIFTRNENPNMMDDIPQDNSEDPQGKEIREEIIERDHEEDFIWKNFELNEQKVNIDDIKEINKENIIENVNEEKNLFIFTTSFQANLLSDLEEAFKFLIFQIAFCIPFFLGNIIKFISYETINNEIATSVTKSKRNKRKNIDINSYKVHNKSFADVIQELSGRQFIEEINLSRKKLKMKKIMAHEAAELIRCARKSTTQYKEIMISFCQLYQYRFEIPISDFCKTFNSFRKRVKNIYVTNKFKTLEPSTEDLLTYESLLFELSLKSILLI